LNLVTIDFETYYDVGFSLSNLTTEEYIRDDRFQVIGFALKVNEVLPSGTQALTMSFLRFYILLTGTTLFYSATILYLTVGFLV